MLCYTRMNVYAFGRIKFKEINCLPILTWSSGFNWNRVFRGSRRTINLNLCGNLCLDAGYTVYSTLIKLLGSNGGFASWSRSRIFNIIDLFTRLYRTSACGDAVRAGIELFRCSNNCRITPFRDQSFREEKIYWCSDSDDQQHKTLLNSKNSSNICRHSLRHYTRCVSSLASSN